MDDLTGKEVKGYKLLEQIGMGGFGAVYRALQPAVGREVAIKIILPAYANRPEFIRSFEHEAQLVARLEHPYIVPLFDYWREPDGAFLVMRMLRHNLRDAIARGPLDLARTTAIMEQIGAALSVAHRNGVVHRDIKPGNILMDDDGNAYLADFGIAKVTTDKKEEEEEMVTGSPAYMSPEQVTGGGVSPQTDIYALGIVLFEMLTGRQPFYDMTAAEMIFKHLQEPVPSLLEFRPDMTEAVDMVIQRATSKDAIDRYTDALAFAAALKQAQVGGDAGDTMSEWEIANIPNPYKGLRPFQEVDANDFFGREKLTTELLERLHQDHPMKRFLAVIGPSGSGKSSVVKAGVLPALRMGHLEGSRDWFIAEMVPGVHPLQELESALLSVAYSPVDNLMDVLKANEEGLLEAVYRILPGGGEFLIVIDQFEEAFTMVGNEEERAHFLAIVRTAILHPESRVRVIVTLRADFMDRPLLYPGYGELTRERTAFVLPLNAEEIERAITGPAQRVGLEVERDLLAAIISDVREEPGALPLLQYALTEVYGRREGRLLTLTGYVASGGALGALARRAEEIYKQLDEDGQEALRQLILRLVTLGEGTQDTRRRITWTELTALASEYPSVMRVQELYVKYRLLTTDRDPQTREPTLEVAHEALIREWKRLRAWLDDSREDIRLQRRLNAAANEWRTASREKTFLMSGALLEQISGWAHQTKIAVTEEERAYLAASLVDKRQQDAREKARRVLQIEMERRARNRLQILVAVMAVAVGIALGLTLFAFTQMQDRENTIATLTLESGGILQSAQTQAADANATISALELQITPPAGN